MTDEIDIITLARQGHTVDKIKKFTRVRVSSIRKICGEHGVTLAERAEKQREAERLHQVFKAMKEMEAKLKRDLATKKPYDDFRDLPAIHLAEHILKDKQLLETVRGIEYVRGEVARPWIKIKEANRVLKSLGCEQITGDPAWLV